MKVVIDFIVAHWKLLLITGLILLTFITSLLPKKVKTLDTVKEIILANLPKFISMVERPGDGKEKLLEVVDLTTAFITKLYPNIQANQYIDFIKSSVESILNTPQRKR